MLVPHGREDAELGDRGLAADEIEDALILVRLEAMRCDQFRADVGLADPCLRGLGRGLRGGSLRRLYGVGAGTLLACPGRRFGCHGSSMSWPDAPSQVRATRFVPLICETRATPGLVQSSTETGPQHHAG